MNSKTEDGALPMKLEGNDKNYLLVPLKLCENLPLKYEIDYESVH